jgi:hypothetical protein
MEAFREALGQTTRPTVGGNLINHCVKYLPTYTSLSNLSLLEINIMFSFLMSLCEAATSVTGRCWGQELPQPDVILISPAKALNNTPHHQKPCPGLQGWWGHLAPTSPTFVTPSSPIPSEY